MSKKDKWVRRFSVDETAKHKKGFTIYKITSVLFPIESPEASTVVSVWKRYSDVQQLHKSMQSLHAGLYLSGKFPPLPRYSFFKRFHKEVIEERIKMIKVLLEFIAEHRLLFSSTDFVNFLQSGYPEPGLSQRTGGVINAIRSSLHLPIEETPPLEYQTSDDDSRSPHDNGRSQPIDGSTGMDTNIIDNISQIPEYQAAEVEIRESPKPQRKLTNDDSFESFDSLESLNGDLYEEINKVAIDKNQACSRKKTMLPDLIIFDAPSTSKFETLSEVKNDTSLNTVYSASMTDSRRSDSQLSMDTHSVSLSSVEGKTRTEDYVFEAGYMLNLAARSENLGDYQRAFDCYKCGIEKLLVGVQSDTDLKRRALVKEKTNKYLSYAEALYKNHLYETDASVLLEQEPLPVGRCLIPLSMLRRSREDLSQYKVLDVISGSVMLVLHEKEQSCYAMKVIQKVPHNLTEFDEYFLQNTQETRQPVLPTNIPYMVSLQAYIETNNLIFLILTYAPGKKLFDYIRNYAKSQPHAPPRGPNLENVFVEPHGADGVCGEVADNTENMERVESTDNNMSVNELVVNSQKLLVNVDKVLREERDSVSVCEKESDTKIEETKIHNKLGAAALPPSALRLWAAELLVALESLHNSGVICRDLNPSNLLLGAGGHLTVTYMYSYPGVAMRLAQLRTSRLPNMYIAPELYVNVMEGDSHVCDYWSYGAILYELLCGVRNSRQRSELGSTRARFESTTLIYMHVLLQPLEQLHGAVFSSHTLLTAPARAPLEVVSLLTQLLTYEPRERLGAGPDGVEEIKRHPYFKSVNWERLYHPGPG